MSLRDAVKEILGRLPLTAEAYQWLRQGRFTSCFSLQKLSENLPGLLEQLAAIPVVKTGKKILIFTTIHYWIDEGVQIGLALAGLGNSVTIGYLPHSNWKIPITRFDLRRHNLYARGIMKRLTPWLKPVSWLDLRPARELPGALQAKVDQISLFDTQYILQDEGATTDNEMYTLRKKRNDHAARVGLAYFEKNRPDVVITVNGMIFEFGAVYETARALGIDAVTIEFGDSLDRIWIGQNRQVVRHETDELWQARRSQALTDEQRKWLATMFQRRQRPAEDDNFIWLTQPANKVGGDRIRTTLGLDQRPVVLLATNVMGDSLTLGRQIFTHTMIDWVTDTVRYFVDHPEVQLVVRIHPGESMVVGPSAQDAIMKVLPHPPEHIHILKATDPVNTYDVLEITDLGLVYVTTTGLEMAARGIPVIVAGRTHYRGRGFTIDPGSREEYFSNIGEGITNLLALRLTADQVELAWNYAYRFFQEFPRPFPWHLHTRWSAIKERPLNYVLGEGLPGYAATFRYLTGEPIDWKHLDEAPLLQEKMDSLSNGDQLRHELEEE
jgi:hypothetical protein